MLRTRERGLLPNLPACVLAAYSGEEPVEVLTARAARTQMRRDARVLLLHRGTCGGQVDIDMEQFHGLLAAYVARISPQEAVQC
jgi:hypothetical protein